MAHAAFPDFASGEEIVARKFQQLSDAGKATQADLDGLRNRDTPREARSFWARLVAHNASGEYNQWKQLQRTASGWQDMPSGLTHTNTSQSLWEKGGNASLIVGASDGDVVYVKPTADSTGTLRYVFESSGEEIQLWIRITDSTAMGGGTSHRWKYEWTQVEWSGDTVATVSGGLSGTTGSNYAVNGAEAFHTSTYAWGVDVTGTDYPASFAAKPIGGGGTTGTHKYDVVVPAWLPPGTVAPRFSLMGSHDGNC